MSVFYFVALVIIAETVTPSRAGGFPTCGGSNVCTVGTTCRSVVTCEKCQLQQWCVNNTYLPKDIDQVCQSQNYSQVILISDPKNSTDYSPLGCPHGLTYCPLSSQCVNTSPPICCRSKIGQDASGEKKGFCPKGAMTICGGLLCNNDYDCPGSQKCCQGCGKLCTPPVYDENLCGNQRCKSGEICVQKQRSCPPDRVCIQALEPTCLPADCAKCKYNEDCRLTRTGYTCFPMLTTSNNPCGGCPAGYVCKDSGIRCITVPCPSFQCYKE